MRPGSQGSTASRIARSRISRATSNDCDPRRAIGDSKEHFLQRNMSARMRTCADRVAARRRGFFARTGSQSIASCRSGRRNEARCETPIGDEKKQLVAPGRVRFLCVDEDRALG